MTNQWSQRASMHMARNRVGVAVVDGCIYAVGGSLGSTHHNTVERSDLTVCVCVCAAQRGFMCLRIHWRSQLNIITCFYQGNLKYFSLKVLEPVYKCVS